MVSCEIGIWPSLDIMIFAVTGSKIREAKARKKKHDQLLFPGGKKRPMEQVD
mgnify:CR=1 FL=1